MKFTYSNRSLLPWKYYVNHSNPDPKISGNVYIDGKEWFNSFLPPFFHLEMVDFMCDMKNKIDKGEVVDFTQYHSMISELFDTPKTTLTTLIGLKKQFNDYFEIDNRVTELIEENSSLEFLLAVAHLGTNIADEYFLPIEGLVTRKDPDHDFLAKTISESIQTEIAIQTFNLDSIMLPMASVITDDFSKTRFFEKACTKICDLMSCTPSELLITLKHLDHKFSCQKFMNHSLAKRIIKNNIAKIENEEKFSELEKAACVLQELNGIITWSKYFPSRSNKFRHRHYSWTDMVIEFKGRLGVFDIVGSSGSEKHGKLLWILNNSFQKNEKLKNDTLRISQELAECIFSRMKSS